MSFLSSIKNFSYQLQFLYHYAQKPYHYPAYFYQNLTHKKKSDYHFLKLPDVKQNKFSVVIDPGHGGPDPGAIGIGGIRETDVVLETNAGHFSNETL